MSDFFAAQMSEGGLSPDYYDLPMREVHNGLSADSLSEEENEFDEAYRGNSGSPTSRGEESSLDSLLAEPNERIGNYILGKTLGEGAFAKVKAAVHAITGTSVAMKIVNKNKIRDPYVLRNLHREGEVLRKLNHKNVISLYEILETESLYCLVLELATGGEVIF